jgi:hypothetical protein
MNDDKDLGLYRKYHITRHDPNGKHDNCYYFVLDTDHDKFSIPALQAYAAACESEYPKLAADLQGVIAVAKAKHLGQPGGKK